MKYENQNSATQNKKRIFFNLKLKVDFPDNTIVFLLCVLCIVLPHQAAKQYSN